jgi:hypothetical protein
VYAETVSIGPERSFREAWLCTLAPKSCPGDVIEPLDSVALTAGSFDEHDSASQPIVTYQKIVADLIRDINPRPDAR